MHKESYRNLRQNSTPGQVPPTPVRVNKEAIRLAVARDKDLSKHCHRALEALLFLAGVRDEIDVSDDALSALMSAEGEDEAVSPTSVRGLLARLEQRGYIEVARKRKGCPERHIELCNPTRARRALWTQETRTRSQARNNEHENCAGSTQNPSSREETQDKKTPNARAKRAASDSESLKSGASSPEPPTLAELMDEGRAEAIRRHARFCEGRCAIVVNTAQSLNDAEGAPHYEVYYHQHAGEDNDLWLEALCQAHKYLAQDRIDGPTARHYFEGIVLELAKRKAASDAACQRQADADQQAEEAQGKAREEAQTKAQVAVDKARVTPSEGVTVDDPELDARIAVDPFADEVGQDTAPEFAAHPAVVRAKQKLALTETLEHLQTLFTGVCRGSEPLWALCMCVATEGYRSLTALVSKIAAEHRDKDDAYCTDRAEGMTVAERTETLKNFEASLEAEKRALNPTMTPMSAFRSDGLSDVKTLVGGIMDAAAKTPNSESTVPSYLAGVTLPRNPREWSAVEEAMGQIRNDFNAADPTVRNDADAAGTALANAESPRESEFWEQWRKVGVYHAFLALMSYTYREENIRRTQLAAPLDQEDRQDTDEVDPFML